MVDPGNRHCGRSGIRAVVDRAHGGRGNGAPAGEAFSLITGADLALRDLELSHLRTSSPVPTTTLTTRMSTMDADESLPWPDPQKIEEWWVTNSSRFQKGTRYFMGAP